MSKFSPFEQSFFQSVDWNREMQSFPINRSDYVTTPELVKYLLLSNGYKLIYDNIEMTKMSLLEFLLSRINSVQISKYYKTDEYLKQLLTPEDKKMCVIYNHYYWVSVKFLEL